MISSLGTVGDILRLSRIQVSLSCSMEPLLSHLMLAESLHIAGDYRQAGKQLQHAFGQ